MSLILSFDIGYASIGWCVLSRGNEHPEFLATGAVTFPSDDCLASQRRNLRRTRRHIRSTRQRIERMKRWLVHRGVLSRADLDRPGHPAPFLLAAAALQGHRTLTAWELWTVLRWYAHNRGYDGNLRWARGEEEAEDTEKQANARGLMDEHGTGSMAETVCACLGLSPADHDRRISSALPYKTLNAAYPRDIVTKEAGHLLSLHLGKIEGLNATIVRHLMSAEELGTEARTELATAGIKLPKRYTGGLLFGQLVPRFDNRIINRCPITWARVHDAVLRGEFSGEKGEPLPVVTPGMEIGPLPNDPAPGLVERAKRLADKFAKVPAAKSPEFLRYRFARILANLKADGRPLSPDLRNRLWDLAERLGSLTPGAIAKEIRAALGNVPTNLEAYFKIHPDSTDALALDPAQAEVRKAEGKRARLSPIWNHLPEATREHALEVWKRRGSVSLASLLDHAGSPTAAVDALKSEFAGLKPKKGAPRFASFDEYLLRTNVSPDYPSGRAPYSRPILEQVVRDVLEGFDPTRSATEDEDAHGNKKTTDGVIHDLGIPGSRVRQLQAERPIDQLTNNHLVRHRMLILDRLVDDIMAEFCTGGMEVGQVVVEVARELKEFSGMTAKQIASELNSRLKDFKAAVAYLEKHAPDLESSGGIIRKCRIAMDLAWQCPFTGETYDPYDLPKLEREHIIPYATRNTSALHALVLTWPEINRMKGKRTARQFIAESEGKPVEGKPNLSILTLRNYDALVEKLDTKGHDDDRRRKKARKALLATNDFEDKELGFTEGQLTQTSQLMKLAMGALKEKKDAGGKRVFENAHIDPLPGPVTAEIRKSWRITGTLALACPEILDESGDVRPKNEIRGLTHLHHALDAATLALAAHYFPLRLHGKNQSGLIWQALMKRKRSKDEKGFLQSLGIFETYQRTRGDHQTVETDVRLRDLNRSVKEALARSLAQGRVMQHLPADRSGAKAELTTWGVTAVEGEGDDARIQLRQRTSVVEDGRRKIDTKTREERAGKLLGIAPKNGIGKLKAIKGAIIIGENYGIALDPAPVVIPFHDVPARLEELRAANGGKPVRVLRNGMLIRLESSPARSQQDYSGIWRIASIKNNKGSFLLDMIRPGYVTPQNGVAWSGMNKTLAPLLACGLTILPRNYCGYGAKA